MIENEIVIFRKTENIERNDVTEAILAFAEYAGVFPTYVSVPMESYIHIGCSSVEINNNKINIQPIERN